MLRASAAFEQPHEVTPAAVIDFVKNESLDLGGALAVVPSGFHERPTRER
jgi:hypothetical protein